MSLPVSTSEAPPAAQIDQAVVDRLIEIVGARRVLHQPSELLTYAADALPSYHKKPALAVFPGTRDELVAVVRELARRNLPFVPRGSGTGLSGGALADGAVLVGLNRLNRVLSIDAENLLAVVEPGVVNVALTRAVAAHGLHYAPDPSSQAACTIGGNVAENAGGPHCLKYGVTTNHIVALTVLLPDGEIVTLGRADGEQDGYDLVGAFVGSEGCFGIALDITVRLSRNPEAIRTLLADFMTLDAAARAVTAIVATGIIPAALEMIDQATIRAVESSIYAAGYPTDAAAALLIEVDGALAGLEVDVATIEALCRANGARTVRVARDEVERTRLWQGRKKAFGAMGRVSSHLVVQDAVVPRTKLPEVLAQIHRIGKANRRERVQRVSRRRRQFASEHHLRRLGRRRNGARACRDERDHDGVRRGGRNDHGRARRWSRQGAVHGDDLFAGLVGDDVRAARGLRPGAPLEPGQGRSGALLS